MVGIFVSNVTQCCLPRIYFTTIFLIANFCLCLSQFDVCLWIWYDCLCSCFSLLFLVDNKKNFMNIQSILVQIMTDRLLKMRHRAYIFLIFKLYTFKIVNIQMIPLIPYSRIHMGFLPVNQEPRANHRILTSSKAADIYIKIFHRTRSRQKYIFPSNCKQCTRFNEINIVFPKLWYPFFNLCIKNIRCNNCEYNTHCKYRL